MFGDIFPWNQGRKDEEPQRDLSSNRRKFLQKTTGGGIGIVGISSLPSAVSAEDNIDREDIDPKKFKKQNQNTILLMLSKGLLEVTEMTCSDFLSKKV